MCAVAIQPLCGPLETGTPETARKYANAHAACSVLSNQMFVIDPGGLCLLADIHKHLLLNSVNSPDLSQYLTTGGKFCFLLKGKKKKNTGNN